MKLLDKLLGRLKKTKVERDFSSPLRVKELLPRSLARVPPHPYAVTPSPIPGATGRIDKGSMFRIGVDNVKMARSTPLDPVHVGWTVATAS